MDVLRRKSVRCGLVFAGCDIEIIGGNAGGDCSSLARCTLADLLRLRIHKMAMIRQIPSTSPGTNPAANELPEKPDGGAGASATALTATAAADDVLEAVAVFDVVGDATVLAFDCTAIQSLPWQLYPGGQQADPQVLRF